MRKRRGNNVENSCIKHIRMGISLVVAAIDDFNNKPISTNRLHVWIEGEKPAVQKEGGYYVFVNLRQTEFVLNMESKVYDKQQIYIDVRKLFPYSKKVLKIRMFPNHSYPIPKNTTCIEGRAEPNSILLAYKEEYMHPYKLQYSYQAGEDKISIFHPEDVDIEGKTLFIKNKDEAQMEFFQVEEKKEEEKEFYCLTLPLTNSYKKIGTVIYPVYTIETDKNGEFYLPIANIYEDKIKFSFCIKGKENNKKKVELLMGRVNKIDLTDIER